MPVFDCVPVWFLYSNNLPRFVFFFNFFERERQRQRQSVSGGGAEREGDTESEAGSRFRAGSTEPNAGLEPTNREIMT